METGEAPKKRRTENRSFRVDSEVLAGLEEEAARKQVSVNTLVNQLLADYIEVGRHRKRLGTVSLSTAAFRQIIETSSDEDMTRSGSLAGKSVPRAYALGKWGRDTVPYLIKFIRENAAITGLYDYSESPTSPDTITLTHQFGRKWSIFIASFFVAAFEDVGARVQALVTDQAVELKLPR